MIADDTFDPSQPAPRTVRRRTSSLSAFMRDMHLQAENNTRAMRRFSTRLLHELARVTTPSLSAQAWQAAAHVVSQAQSQPSGSPGMSTAIPRHRPNKPSLRAIHWVESSPGQTPPLVHLRLSGRFSEVCAELERLAAQEAART